MFGIGEGGADQSPVLAGAGAEVGEEGLLDDSLGGRLRAAMSGSVEEEG